MKTDKILVIDDDPDVRMIARLVLEAGGWSVLEAESGEEGLRRAAAERPDVVLLDMMMPILDGPATLLRLRQQPVNADVPVIFLTARTQRPGCPPPLGCSGVILKPFAVLTLSDEIRRILVASESLTMIAV